GLACGLVERIDVIDVEDDAAPPGPSLLIALGDEVEVARAGTKAGERRRFPAIEHVKSERGVEAHGALHVVGGECDGTDCFDHDATSAASWRKKCPRGATPAHLPLLRHF